MSEDACLVCKHDKSEHISEDGEWGPGSGGWHCEKCGKHCSEEYEENPSKYDD